MPWTEEKIKGYLSYTKQYIALYKKKIDCADLAIASLVDFASKNKLPVRLKYYSGGWKWYNYDPAKDDASKYKKKAMSMLGALNVIDNTKPIPIIIAKPGDLIMTKWSSSLGHARIIHSRKYNSKTGKHEIVWYQGNLPPVVPEKRKSFFSGITKVYGKSPRRWNFEQFDK